MPLFKTNLDIHKNQLLNAVLHKLWDFPPDPVAGQVYYNESSHLAYLYNGQSWAPWGNLPVVSIGDIKQYTIHVTNPEIGKNIAVSRLYQDLSAVRVDAHFSTENTVNFNIDIRSNVNQPGTNITDRPMQATYNATATTAFDHAFLNNDDWLFLTVLGDTKGESIPLGEGTLPDVSVEGEIEGILTVVITCSTS